VTAAEAAQAPARECGRLALPRLISCPTAEFSERHWGRQPLLSRAEELPASFADLFSGDAVDELVSERALRTPFMRMAKDGATLPERAFTRGAGVGAGIADQVGDDQVLRLFADGATMVLQGLHRVWQPLAAFTRDLAADLGHPVQANAYVTPAQSTGFSDHYDVHDVFVLQVDGEKRWRVRPPVHPAPMRHEPWTDHRAAVEQAAAATPLVDAVLRPGDCLYLPRGYLHAATALGAVSTHVTIGVHPWTRRHLADEAVRVALDRASEDAAVRASLPLGVDAADPRAWAGDLELVRSALLRALGEVRAADLAEALARRVRDAQRADPVHPLAQLRAAESLADDSEVALRPHLSARLGAPREGSAVLDSRAGAVTVAEDDLPAVARLLEAGTARVGDLGQPLARQLVLAGILLSP
jgi:ribosomal protein L16 Arg81 hydroxylase